ncbi:hypothetical protein Taro_008719, partial [Colocasia esculenta]|nr:hypothetical protein [Colocasia esculenta]
MLSSTGELDDEICAVRFFRATLRLDDWRVGGPQPVSRDVECNSVLCVLLVVVLSQLPWSPFSTCLCAVEPARFQFSQCAPEGAMHYDTGSCVLTECGFVGSLRVLWSFVTPCWLCLAAWLCRFLSRRLEMPRHHRRLGLDRRMCTVLFGLLCTMHSASLWKFRKGVELSYDVFCFPMSGVLSQAVVWPVCAGCVVMVFGLSVTAAWRLFPSWCQRVVTLECVVFPDLVVCVWGPEGFGLSALDLVECLASLSGAMEKAYCALACQGVVVVFTSRAAEPVVPFGGPCVVSGPWVLLRVQHLLQPVAESPVVRLVTVGVSTIDVQVAGVDCVLAESVLPLVVFWRPSMLSSMYASGIFWRQNLAAIDLDVRGELDDEICAVRFFRATLRLDDWRVGGLQPVSRDIECDSVLCVLLVVVLSRLPWSPFSTCLCAVEPARFQFSQCAPKGAAHYDTGSCVLTE